MRRVSAAGLTVREQATLSRLRTPTQIQAFVNGLASNYEIGGETVLSAREVLRQRQAHCVEAAFVAACALWLQGEPPLLMHLDCDPSDYPHVIALYRRERCWGAISKSNNVRLRFRDPIYRSLRELALSYFHEYVNKRGEKTLRTYSTAFDLRRLDPTLWVTNAQDCWEAHDRIAGGRHYALLSAAQVKTLARIDPFERRIGKLKQYEKPPRR